MVSFQCCQRSWPIGSAEAGYADRTNTFYAKTKIASHFDESSGA